VEVVGFATFRCIDAGHLALANAETRYRRHQRAETRKEATTDSKAVDRLVATMHTVGENL
jgi:hypothetical protein